MRANVRKILDVIWTRRPTASAASCCPGSRGTRTSSGSAGTGTRRPSWTRWPTTGKGASARPGMGAAPSASWNSCRRACAGPVSPPTGRIREHDLFPHRQAGRFLPAGARRASSASGDRGFAGGGRWRLARHAQDRQRHRLVPARDRRAASRRSRGADRPDRLASLAAQARLRLRSESPRRCRGEAVSPVDLQVRGPNDRFLLLWLAQFKSLWKELERGLRIVASDPHVALQSSPALLRADRLKGKFSSRFEERVARAVSACPERKLAASVWRSSAGTPENRFVLHMLDRCSAMRSTSPAYPRLSAGR